ncbi:MAG: DRTGG domain-containing protein [Bacteroidales bacterium]|nr:DRTGG domain-containing protein [Bacteroidales bacterium]
MKISEIAKILDAQILVSNSNLDLDIQIKYGFASDLMSDVLTLDEEEVVLITGLCNIQTIRTAEMANIRCLLFVRNKQASEEMIELALENDMIVLQCSYSLFRTVGILYENGLCPVY